MTAELMPFIYEGAEVRTFSVHGEPWFVAADVCAVLGYRMASDATRWLDDDEKGTQPVRTPGGVQQLTVVSEAGLYNLVLRSQVEGARAFKRWVTHEVLPAIRKTGGYGNVAVEAIDRKTLAQWVIDEANRADAAEAKVAELEPAAAVARDLIDATGDYSVREAAQLLCRAGVATGERRLFDRLRQLGWIQDAHRAYQRHIEAGRVLLRCETFYDRRTGEPHLSTQIRLTGKGVADLHKLLGGNGPLAITP